MTIRKRVLPPGWYPGGPDEIRSFATMALKSFTVEGDAFAAIAPHAGWTFSGTLAARSIASLKQCATIAVVGGHLRASSSPLAALEDAFETPLGRIEADVELREALDAELRLSSVAAHASGLEVDDEADNTVEVQLPLIAALKPGVRILWLRAPNGGGAIALGSALARAGAKLGRNLACLGSTDLTHYGPNYGFSPVGRGLAAESWVRDVNDARFIQAVLALDAPEVLRRGECDHSACSSGAAAAAIAFARVSGGTRASLLGYATSLDIRRDESFVGYGAISFR